MKFDMLFWVWNVWGFIFFWYGILYRGIFRCWIKLDWMIVSFFSWCCLFVYFFILLVCLYRIIFVFKILKKLLIVIFSWYRYMNYLVRFFFMVYRYLLLDLYVIRDFSWSISSVLLGFVVFGDFIVIYVYM